MVSSKNITAAGKRTSFIRPGFTCKSILLGELPLLDGRIVSEASINDMHAVYSSLIHKENLLRTKDKKLHGMASHSWYMMFQFAKLLKLVEFVREEKMLHPPDGKNLYSIRRQLSGRMGGVISKRRIFRLTDAGKQDEVAWGNLTLAWKNFHEGTWIGPKTYAEVGIVGARTKIEVPLEPEAELEEEAKQEVAAEELEEMVERAGEGVANIIPKIVPETPTPTGGVPITPAVKRPRGRPPKLSVVEKAVAEGGIPVPVQETGTLPPETQPTPPPSSKKATFVPIALTAAPTFDRVGKVLTQLRIMQEIGTDNAEVKAEIDRIQTLMGNWAISVEDISKSKGSVGATKIKLQRILGLINKIDEELTQPTELGEVKLYKGIRPNLPRAIEYLVQVEQLYK